MSSQSKRKAESEEVSRIKKPRKGDGDDFNNSENEDYIDSEFDDDELEAIDSRNIIPVGSRTRGKLGRNGEAAKTPSQVEDNGPGSDMAGKGKQKDAPDKYHTRPSQRKPFFVDEEEGSDSEEDDHDELEDVTSGDGDDSEEEDEE